MVESNSLFVLGAGFTKAVCPEAPLNADLLHDMIAAGHASVLGHYHEKYRIDDIEKLLTHIDLDASENTEIKADRATINGEISSYFSRFRFSEKDKGAHPWLEKFVFEVLKSNDAIITLNYDCFLEGALDYYEVWTPNGGYARIDNMLAGSIPQNRGALLYKIHGSENFVESSLGSNRGQTVISFEINPSVFPKSGAHSHFGGGAIDPRPFIIAPSFVKIPHVDIAAMMLEALEKTPQATNLVIIGCGMRPEDNFLWLLLCQFLNRTLSHRKRLLLIGPSSQTIWQRISNYWVGDICRFADVFVIPCGIESGVEAIRIAIAAKD